jgi:dTDP-4-amino-4,6-dideoxygalactose transaminase
VRHVVFVSNGTIAIQILLKALGVVGDVITTPFSYVATTSTLVWEGCAPVFADVCSDTLTLDPSAVAKALTPRTGAILATHVYGTPCDVEALAAIGASRGIPVLYDAAHAFGARYAGRALAAWGTASTLSFHATKLFHTIEGGAVVTDNDELARRLRYTRSFGHLTPESFQGLGINAKNSEVHAAMGLALLPRVPAIIERRLALCARYTARLGDLPLRIPITPAGTEANGAYFPVLFRDEAELLRVRLHLSDRNVMTRRYFYPSLDSLPYVRPANVSVAHDAAGRVLSLPLFYDLPDDAVDHIAALVRQALNA